MKQVYFTLLVLFVFGGINAQKNITNYQFAESIEGFTSISATGTNMGTGDDSEFPLDLSGTFSFVFNDNSYSKFTVGVNGAIVLGTTSAQVYANNDINQSAITPIIAPYWDDMDMSYTGGAVYYKLSGVAGSQILTIEWHDTETYDDSKNSKATNVNYQLKLYEETGVIQFVYGDMSNAANWYPDGGAIGFIDDESGTLAFLSVTPGSPATYSTEVGDDNITKAEMAAIPTGTAYTFTYVIPTCIQPDNLNVTEITATSVILNWEETATATHWDIEYGISGFTPTGTPTEDDLTTTSFNLGSLNPETAYQFYVRADCGADNTDVSYWTGPFEFTTLASCPEPINLHALHKTATSVYLGWTQAGPNTTWDIEWGLDGFAPTGTPTENDITSNPFLLASLTSSTTYNFYVRADCGGEQSDWVGPYEFTTLCSAITPEFTEDFSVYPANETPPCWDENKGSVSEGPVGTQGVSGWTGDEFGNTGSNQSARINLYYNNRKDWLLSPLFDLSAGAYELNFDVALTKFSGTTPEDMGVDDEIQLLYSEDGLTWNNLFTWAHGNEPSTTGDNVNLDITSITGANVRFAFWATDGEIDDTKDFYFYVDNFTIRTQASCPAPSILSAINITSTQADLTWAAGSSETTWDIEFGISGFTPTGTPTEDDITANPFTITELSSATNYDFYVRADCGANNIDVSDWAGPYPFKTAYAVPFAENFDDFMPLDWREGKAILTENTDVNFMSADWDQVPYLNGDASNQAASLDVFGTYRQDWLTTPFIDLGTGNYQLQFNLGLTDMGNSNPPEAEGEDNKFAVIISTDNGETWSSLNALQIWDNTTTPSFYDIPNTGETITLNLSEYSGVVMFAFYGESTIIYSNEYADLFVDDVTVTQVVKVDKIDDNNVNVYPNPSNGLVKIKLDTVYNLEVFDITGKIIENKVIENNSEINISNSGVYFLKFSNTQKSFTKKVIIK